jgi:hypothetical protein
VKPSWQETLAPQAPERKDTGPKRAPLTPLLIAVACTRGEDITLTDADNKKTVLGWLADRRRLANEHGSLDEVLWVEDQITRLGGNR